MLKTTRRKFLAASGAAAAVATVPRFAIGQSANPEIVIGAAQPITGPFAFAGASLNAGLSDYIAWRNENGGVMGRKLRYVAEDSGFKVDQGVAIFKKIMASEKPAFFYGDRTEWCKAVAQEAIASGSVITASPSLAGALADPVNMPHHFISGPSYGAMHEVLMEHIARSNPGKKPTIALVYTETEFGNDGIPASKARAQKLGLPIVAEIVTKQSGIDVAPEVAKLRRAKPDFIVFQGYILAPLPEFVKQLVEAGVQSQIMGTIWSGDKLTYDAIAAAGGNYTGVTPYRYFYETGAPMLATMREYVQRTRPQMNYISFFYTNAWLSGMVFAEIAERCIKANKPFTLPNMKAALESMTAWDSGGISGLPVNLSGHQIASGRLYKYNSTSKAMEPGGDWISV